jgi:hypothetical protein
VLVGHLGHMSQELLRQLRLSIGQSSGVLAVTLQFRGVSVSAVWMAVLHDAHTCHCFMAHSARRFNAESAVVQTGVCFSSQRKIVIQFTKESRHAGCAGWAVSGHELLVVSAAENMASNGCCCCAHTVVRCVGRVAHLVATRWCVVRSGSCSSIPAARLSS